jgi:DNA-directed RNA polymerase subunit RPC12/RpoP
MKPTLHDDERQPIHSPDAYDAIDELPFAREPLKSRVTCWLGFQVVFFSMWGIHLLWESGVSWFLFWWLLLSSLAYMVIDGLWGYSEAEIQRKEEKSAVLKCTHCSARYTYLESSVDSSDNSVECQNCAKRFHIDAWKDIQNY